jgi:ATP-dependent protease Clp ATPase subunit
MQVGPIVVRRLEQNGGTQIDMAQSGASNTCSFCNNASANVIAGPKVFICFECSAAYTKALKLPAGSTSADQTNSQACSFCGRTEPAVQRVAAGASASICNVCLTLCEDIRARR